MITVIGNFGKSNVSLDGQTVKTRIVAEELIAEFGKNNVRLVNTNGGIKTLFKFPFMAVKAFMGSRDIVILPAQNAVRVMIPAFGMLTHFFKHRRIHYVVIGGWLPTFLTKRPVLAFFLRKTYMIYAETHSMVRDLKEMGYESNVVYMPNCKPLNVLKQSQLEKTYSEPYKLCTFSRVWREKGITEAVEAVKFINEKYGRTVYSLDIYGKILNGEEEWFEKLQKDFPKYIKYQGAVAFNKSVEVLKNYFFLLFPTRYLGEGIPGTIIDSFAAGLPVVSSFYPNFSEIIDDGVTGYGYEFCNNAALIEVMENIAMNPQSIISLKPNCIQKAKMFQPNRVIEVLVNKINDYDK